MEGATEVIKFRAILDGYYRAWFRYHPEAAVDIGVEGYAHLLTPFASEDRAALVCLNDQLIVSLDEIDRSALGADDALDHDVARAAAFLENQRILDVESRRCDPEALLPINAIYQLTIRPIADAPDALAARLAAIPAHLHDAAQFVQQRASMVPPLWVQSAITAARAGAEFIHGLQTHPWCVRVSSAAARLHDAAQAFIGYADFLEREVAARASSEISCGRSYFGHLLSHRHFLGVSVDELERFGVALCEDTRRELRAACQALAGTPDVVPALERVLSAPAPDTDLIQAYREAMTAAQKFVAERALVTLPAHSTLEVMETPIFLRHQIPFAAYSEPTPTDPQQRGLYYVTPPLDADQLAQHSTAAILHTCVHEAWPGHHLQFVTANSQAASRSLPRLLNASATFYEGWALYCEQLMEEQGFLSQPEQRLLMLRDRLWRALRVVIDIGLHVRGMSVEQAADLLVSELGFPRAHALADVTWYTRAPAVPLGYATGWAVIVGLREHVRATSSTFTLRAFHDQLLATGSVALPLVVQTAFGGTTWENVRQRVLLRR